MATKPTSARTESDSEVPRVAVIPEVQEQHFSEFQALWAQRQEMLQSPEWNAQDLRAWEQRIEAHLDGLRGCGEAVIAYVEGGLPEDDWAVAFASVCVLLHLNTEAAVNLVIEALLGANGEQLDGIRDALCQGPIGRLADRLGAAVDSAPPPIALAAAYALAWHGRESRWKQWRPLLAHEDPAVRAAAWKVVSVTKT